MSVSLSEAQSHLPDLIRAMEDGESILITHDGRPIAQIAPPPPVQDRKVCFDGLRDRIELLPGWDDPIDPDQFLSGQR